MHKLQKILIKRLVENNGLTFAQLTKGYDQEKNIVFHLKQLVKDELITKRDDSYYITPKGINARSTFDIATLNEQDVKTFFCGFLCKFDDNYLIKVHDDAEETFYNFPSGKPEFGEKIDDSLTRLFYEEANLSLPSTRFAFDSLHLKTVKTEQKDVLFDDAFCVYKLEVSPNEKKNMRFRRNVVWMNNKQISELNNKWPEIDLCVLRTNWQPYQAYDVICNYVVRKADL